MDIANKEKEKWELWLRGLIIGASIGIVIGVFTSPGIGLLAAGLLGGIGAFIGKKMEERAS